jgi:signal transduction histidine kinase
MVFPHSETLLLGYVVSVTKTQEPPAQSQAVGVARLALEAVGRERARVAEILRSDTAQVLTAALVAAASAGESGDGAASRERLAAARAELRLAVTRLQSLAASVWPSVLADFGLAAATRAVCDRLAEEHGIRIEVEITGDHLRLTEGQETLTYCILEETLSNAIQHARAHRIRVALRQASDELVLEVEDDGIGFPVNRDSQETSGLPLMRARTGALAGSLAIRSEPDAGTLVALHVPLKGAAR